MTGTFFTLDIDKTRAAFNKLPWVRDAQVRRTWPDTLEIGVAEYVALARWGENGLVDVSGVWFDAASDQALPVFYGPAGAQKDMAQMLLQLRPDFTGAGLTPVKLFLSDRRAWSVELDNGVHLELGRGDAEKRAADASPPVGRICWRNCHSTLLTWICVTRMVSLSACLNIRHRRRRTEYSNSSWSYR